MPVKINKKPLKKEKKIFIKKRNIDNTYKKWQNKKKNIGK